MGDSDTRGWAIIDCIFNISLLYWASEESGDPRFRRIAMLHADTVMEHFIRPDGSVCHIVEFDPESGKMVRSHGGQGFGEGSSWTRGQGWALYGFTNSYAHTGKQEYLDTARKVAAYCIPHIPESGIIPVDFRQPEDVKWEDSCGACVIAGGLLELAKFLPEAEREALVEPAFRILKAIADTRAATPSYRVAAPPTMRTGIILPWCMRIIISWRRCISWRGRMSICGRFL